MVFFCMEEAIPKERFIACLKKIDNHLNDGGILMIYTSDYDPKESIAKLEATKTLEDLQFVWRSLSAKERKDGDIIKVAQKLRKTYDEKI